MLPSLCHTSVLMTTEFSNDHHDLLTNRYCVARSQPTTESEPHYLWPKLLEIKSLQLRRSHNKEQEPFFSGTLNLTHIKDADISSTSG
jgi:hypothetical protein